MNTYAQDYPFIINPKDWYNLPQFGWMNPRILTLTLILKEDYDITSLQKLKDAKIKFKLKNKKYKNIINDIINDLSKEDKDTYLDLVIAKYLLSIINYTSKP